MKEYAIAMADEPIEVHRGPMTKEEAQTWIEEWEEMGPRRKGMFLIIEREIPSWTLSDANFGNFELVS